MRCDAIDAIDGCLGEGGGDRDAIGIGVGLAHFQLLHAFHFISGTPGGVWALSWAGLGWLCLHFLGCCSFSGCLSVCRHKCLTQARLDFIFFFVRFRLSVCRHKCLTQARPDLTGLRCVSFHLGGSDATTTTMTVTGRTVMVVVGDEGRLLGLIIRSRFSTTTTATARHSFILFDGDCVLRVRPRTRGVDGWLSGVQAVATGAACARHSSVWASYLFLFFILFYSSPPVSHMHSY
ncbi:hypothetical protein B0H14DRAFT_53863 [Mycena olivaceomarginata]|nr:hypothetical protein B0H14DRAFT_53863 [Mycena olivaceomarginata]